MSIGAICSVVLNSEQPGLCDMLLEQLLFSGDLGMRAPEPVSA